MNCGLDLIGEVLYGKWKIRLLPVIAALGQWGDGFNTRNIDSVFSVMNPDVQWPKAFEGGCVTGFDQVRAYWLRQWAEIDPNVQPIRVTDLTDGTVEVLVHQVVKDLSGIELFNGQVRHIYTIESGLIQRMDIGSDQAVHPSS